MRKADVEYRLKSRLLHLTIENRAEDLREKDLYPKLMYWSFEMKRLIRRIPVIGELIRRIYLLVRYGIKSSRA